MENNNSQLKNDSTFLRDISAFQFSESSIFNNFEAFGEMSFQFLKERIDDIFEKQIKPLRINFSLELYEKAVREIRNIIIKLRKEYYKNSDSMNMVIPSQTTNFINIMNQNANTNTNMNINTNMSENEINTNSRSNTNARTNTQTARNLIKKFAEINETTMTAEIFPPLKSGKGTNILYNQMLEISNFLMSYEDIFINYDNKSAFITAKLFLQMATLHFIKNIKKQDFILCLMNKSCNILSKYKYLQKNDENIKKILALEKKEFERMKALFRYDYQAIDTIQKKLNKEIEKIDLSLDSKAKIIKEDIKSNNLFNNGKREVKEKPLDDIQIKINKLKNEINIINDIQNNLGENYKLYTKDPIKNELEQFNLLINKISQYDTPLIRQRFLDIIMRNKEVFRYINENILMPKIPKKVFENYNLYPFNKNLSIFVDKFLITGKTILEELYIPLEQDYSYNIKQVETFAKNFLNTLSQGLNKNNEENKKVFEYELNYYYIMIFSFMVASKMKKKVFFNRIGALITTGMEFSNLSHILRKDVEEISNVGSSNNDGGETSMITFDYENIKNNTISFLFEEKRIGPKKNGKAISYKISNLDTCSILSKKIFNDDPINIVFTIALKYWAIQRKIFKYDFVKRKDSKEMLDDCVLLYLIYYFFMHKGLIEPFTDFFKEIEKEKDKKEEQNEDKKDDIKDEDNNIEKEKDKIDEEKEKGEAINKYLKINFNDNENVVLKKLGELFIEFFWFIHELIKLTEEETNKEKTIYISLTKKQYLIDDMQYNEIDNKYNQFPEKIKIPVLLILKYNEEKNFYKIDKRQAKTLKNECIRALYYLLNKEGGEIFAFQNTYPY